MKRRAGNQSFMLMERGMTAQRRGDLASAERCYKQVLAREPRHADALHLLGLIALSRGRVDEAMRLIKNAITIFPKVAIYHANLGRVFGESGDPDGAVAALERAVALDPMLLQALYNLGLACESRGDWDAAREHYEAASFGDEDTAIPEAAFNLGNLHAARGRDQDAVVAYERALELRPGYTRAFANLGYTFQKLGKFERALEVYRAILAEDPNDAEAAHMLSALSGQTPDRADPGYVAKFFDDYAVRFESVLVNELAYDTPRAIAEAAASVLAGTGRFERVLDLGCGTGLSGRALRAFCDVLVGVDLSEKMLERAKLAGGYDELQCADLLSYLEGSTTTFDLVTAADVLNYLGDLSAVFGGVALRLSDNGVFVFSTEVGSVEGFALDRTGRFLHERAYVEATAREAGFLIVSCEERTLRLERGEPVRGNLFVLRRRHAEPAGD